MKKKLIIVAVILLPFFGLVYLVYLYATSIFRNIDIKLNLRDSFISLKTRGGFNFNDLLTKGENNFDVPLSVFISNTNKININITSLVITASFNNTIIASTSDSINKKDITLAASTTSTVSDVVRVFVNGATVGILQSLITGVGSFISYNVSAKINNIPFRYYDNFKI